ncbi:hypothetical protein [Streptomyces fungicidicus]
MFSSDPAMIIAVFIAIIVALVGALVVRESGGSPREAITSSGRAFLWTLGVSTAMLIYISLQGITVIHVLR